MEMAGDNPLLQLGMLVGCGVIFKWWLDDYRLVRGGLTPLPAKIFPGTTPAPAIAVVLAIAGSLLLLAIETGGEYALGLTAQQSQITVLFGLYTLAAAFVEELIFRGYLVIENRGSRRRGIGIVAASLLFAALHPFLWEWKETGLTFHWTSPKAWFSTTMIFAGSLWFYFVRYMRLNPRHSLVPCIAAHAAKNAGVLAIKYAQGFVGGWW